MNVNNNLENSTPPFFSIVIPTHNRAEILNACLNSVLVQTFKDFEVILIDDGSTDNTRELYGNYPDARLRYIYQEASGSAASPRNTGIRYAKGDWICFLDSDDYWYKEKLQKVKKVIETNGNYDVVCHNELQIEKGSDKETVLCHGIFYGDLYQSLLLIGNCVSPSAVAVKRDMICRHKIVFDESHDFDTTEDYDFWLNLAFHKARYCFIDDVLGVYVIHGENSFLDFKKHIRNTLNVVRKHIYSIQKFSDNKASLWRQASARIFFCAAKTSLRRKRLLFFIYYIVRSIFFDVRCFFKLMIRDSKKLLNLAH
jgi:glycosyltransferase involved in cell wall biosynthesis